MLVSFKKCCIAFSPLRETRVTTRSYMSCYHHYSFFFFSWCQLLPKPEKLVRPISLSLIESPVHVVADLGVQNQKWSFLRTASLHWLRQINSIKPKLFKLRDMFVWDEVLEGLPNRLETFLGLSGRIIVIDRVKVMIANDRDHWSIRIMLLY
jgi:hypothetical protein